VKADVTDLRQGLGRLFRHALEPIRVLCARATQKSIAESVHRLLKDQIVELQER
jgi:hypothetical protein